MIEPHGGELVNRVVPEKEKLKILEEIRDLPKITVGLDALLDVENIATGVFSPIKGFMTGEELLSVGYNMCLPDGTVWTIPIILQFKEKPKVGERIVLQDEEGKAKAVVDIREVYKIDLPLIAKLVWGTESEEHPGVKLLYSKGEWVVGGDVWLLERINHPLRDWILEPEETRKIFEYRGWKTVVGFQTRNAPHKAHEYLQRIGLEVADGLFINPVLGWRKSDDFEPQTILTAYEYLINNYYPKKRVLFSGLATAMRYAGPREAVFHALVRKNFGCTHFIVGRDHAGVGNFYDPYEAHRIFDRLPKDIGIEIIRVSAVFYCKNCDCMASEKSCGHGEEERVYVSMTKIRDMLRKGVLPPDEMIRRDIAHLLMDVQNLTNIHS
ncbi:sulfate adenylyltransferase [Hydrogenobacter thermophilus]|uniref:sulfate adenylyltransferase n=1 Tax=Hydrogenobacter thermophilus TaxID=940 RepID=UPI0030F87431